MNPLFTLWKSFDFMNPADSVRWRCKTSVLPQFCASFDVVSCGVLPESGGVGTPAETLFTMGKGLKEFQLCDSRRLPKKPQDAQDDVTELFDLFRSAYRRGRCALVLSHACTAS